MDEKLIAEIALFIHKRRNSNWSAIAKSYFFCGEGDERRRKADEMVLEIKDIGRENFRNKYGVDKNYG